MADFSFISRCGQCSVNPSTLVTRDGHPWGEIEGSGNNSVNIDCGDDGCCIDISIDNKKISCQNSTSLMECIGNPDSTYTNGKATATPIAWHVSPFDVYHAVRKISSPCGSETSDDVCVPYNQTYHTNDPDNVNSGRCGADEANNYALLSDPEKTAHPIYEMTYCEWLSAPTQGSPPVPGGGCSTIEVPDDYRNNDPDSTNMCTNGFRVPQCDVKTGTGLIQTCCPGSYFDSLSESDATCKTGSNYYFEVKNCQGYNKCKQSCSFDENGTHSTGMCECTSDSDCQSGNKCNVTYGKCYTPNMSETDQCVVRPKITGGYCRQKIIGGAPCTAAEIAAGKGSYKYWDDNGNRIPNDNCCAGQTHTGGRDGTTCVTGNEATCCDSNMECRSTNDNKLLMPGGQQTWDDNEAYTDNYGVTYEGNKTETIGVGICKCTNTTTDCVPASEDQDELYGCIDDPNSNHDRKVCVSGTPERCHKPTNEETAKGIKWLDSTDTTKGRLSGPPNFINLGQLPGFGGLGCKGNTSCNMPYGNLLYGYCECDTDDDCDESNGYVCREHESEIVNQYFPGFEERAKKCVKIVEQPNLKKPRTLEDTVEGVEAESTGNTDYDKYLPLALGSATYPTGGYIIKDTPGWNNERCNYCDDLVEQGCKWSHNDKDCNKITGYPNRYTECSVEIDAPDGQLTWEGWNNDWMLCCPNSGLDMPMNKELQINFIDINKNMCSSFAQFAGTNKEAQKTDFCSLYCPSKETQEIWVGLQNADGTPAITEEQVCDLSYYNLCKQSGCEPDVGFNTWGNEIEDERLKQGLKEGWAFMDGDEIIEYTGCAVNWKGMEPASLPRISAPITKNIITFSTNNKESVPACNEGFANTYIGGTSYTGVYEGFSL